MKPYQQNTSKKEQVEAMFDNIAPRYDLLNRLLSLNIDRYWRKSLVRSLSKDKPKNILDLACGTADLTIAIHNGTQKLSPKPQITGADLSAQMVKVGIAKLEKREINIPLIVADAENLPFENNTFDAVTCAFGVRNFENLPKGLTEINRILNQNGKIFVLEFSTPKNSIFAKLFKFYFHKILPTIGGLISKDRKAYTYLPQSVEEFPCGEKFLKILNDCGFENCTAKTMTFGVATLYTAQKSNK